MGRTVEFILFLFGSGFLVRLWAVLSLCLCFLVSFSGLCCFFARGYQIAQPLCGGWGFFVSLAFNLHNSLCGHLSLPLCHVKPSSHEWRAWGMLLWELGGWKQSFRISVSHYGACYRLEGVKALSSERWICSRSGIKPSFNCQLDIFRRCDGSGFSRCI